MHLPRSDRPGVFVLLMLCGLLMPFTAGCRLHPVSLASMAIGDAINDADVKKRQEKLVDQPVSAADEMFGAREETWVDANIEGRELITYPVKGDLMDTQNWVVEAHGGKLVALSRVKRNIDGVEDVIKSEVIEDKVIGKSPDECRKDAELKEPLCTLRSRESGELIRLYDIRNWTNSRGARYCMLRFDEADRCKLIRLIGVSASSVENPAVQTSP